uniref:Uncharacterized protein n=1 Tax=Chrysotila carterae TaxID=13221 RepID=A0A7S4EUD9_CHRCT
MVEISCRSSGSISAGHFSPVLSTFTMLSVGVALRLCLPPSLPHATAQELERLRRENAELRRQSEVLCGVPPSKVEPSEASDAMTARDANAAITVDVANNAGATGALCASHNGESVAASRYLSASGDAAQVHGGEPSLPELHETIAIETADLVDAAKSVVMDGVTVAPPQIKAARAQAHAQREQALRATQGAGASGVTTLPLASNSPDAVTHEDSHVALCVTDARVAPESNASPSAAHAHAQPVATTADQAAYPAASNSGVAADRASLAALPDVAHGATQPAAATLSSEANLMAGSRCRLSQPSSLRSGIPLSSSIHKLALKAATSAAKSAARSSAALMPGGVGQVASPGMLFAANQQVPYFTLDSPSFDSTAAPAYHLEHAAASVQ